MRIYLATQVVKDDEFEFLILRKLIQVAFRPKSRPRYQRNIVAPLASSLQVISVFSCAPPKIKRVIM